jgi:hypothetical protein
MDAEEEKKPAITKKLPAPVEEEETVSVSV